MDDNLEGKIFEAKVKSVFTTPLKDLFKRKGHYYHCTECGKEMHKIVFSYPALKLLKRHFDSEECAKKGRIRYKSEMDPKNLSENSLRAYAESAIKRIDSEEIIRYSINELKNNNT